MLQQTVEPVKGTNSGQAQNFAKELRKKKSHPCCKDCLLLEDEYCKQDIPKHYDVLVIGEYPYDNDTSSGVFTSARWSMITTMISEIISTIPKSNTPSIGYTYAVRCIPRSVGYKMRSEVLEQCQPLLEDFILMAKPKIVIALGISVYKALGFKEQQKFTDARGYFTQLKLEDTVIPVFLTYNPENIRKSPGLVATLKKDLSVAISSVVNIEETEEVVETVTPVEVSEIINELDKLLNYLNTTSSNVVGIAIDTETTSLVPYDPESRMIMVSLAYSENNGISFPFMHNQHPYTEEELEQIKGKLNEVFQHPKASFVGQNIKFDTKWLRMKSGLNLPPAKADTMLVEHLLDEDKKGLYGLKSLTLQYFPKYGKYEKELKSILEGIQKERLEEYNTKLGEYKKIWRDQLFEKFYSQSETAIQQWCSMLISRNIVELTQVKKLWPVKRNKKTGALLKTFMESAASVFNKIPEHLLPKIEMGIPEPEKPKEVTYEEVPLNILLRYAALDAVLTYKILQKQKERIKEDWINIKNTEATVKQASPGFVIATKPLTWPLEHIIMPLSDILSEVEYRGVRIDRDLLKTYINKLDDAIASSEAALIQEVGHRFNINSGQDLQKILYDELKYTPTKYTEKGAPSTDASTLVDLLDQKKSVFLTNLLSYRKLVKCKSTYLENWLKTSSQDGKIHTQFHINGTATGRLSSSDPNLQNVPFFLKEADVNLKDIFIPDSEEYDLYDLDISNAEMRVLSAYSRDTNLIDAFVSGKDLHCLTGEGISDFTYDQLKAKKDDKSSEEYKVRQISKKVNFGIVYGIGAQGLARQLWDEMRVEYTEAKTQGYLDMYLVKYPGVKSYMDNTMNFTKRFGFTYTFTGRRRRFDIAKYRSKLSMGINRVLRQAINFRIQATSSDLVLFNIISLINFIKQHGGRMLLTVHDSIVFQLPKSMRDFPVKENLDKCITEKTAEYFKWLPVPWKYDVGRGPSYGHTKEEVA